MIFVSLMRRYKFWTLLSYYLLSYYHVYVRIRVRACIKVILFTGYASCDELPCHNSDSSDIHTVMYILILEDDFDMSGVGSTYNVSRQYHVRRQVQFHHNFYLVTE